MNTYSIIVAFILVLGGTLYNIFWTALPEQWTLPHRLIMRFMGIAIACGASILVGECLTWFGGH